MLWKQNTCQKCLDNRLDLSIDWSSLDCHQLSSNPSSIIYFLSLFLRQTEHQLEMLTFDNQPKVHLDLLSSRFWFQPVQIRSPKNSPPSAFDKSTIQIFLPPGNSSIWQFEYFTSSSLTSGAKIARFWKLYLAFSVQLVNRMILHTWMKYFIVCNTWDTDFFVGRC